jgi:secreted PhoX family phosphatase
VIDGSVWDPFTRTLFFSSEGNGSSSGGIWEATPDFPSTVVDRLGLFGRGGFEGMQVDNDGNIWIVEDIGGKFGTSGVNLATNNAKQPNSFVFRFVPYNTRDLDAGGKLQVLQVDATPGNPSTFHGGASPSQAQIDADITSQFMKDLHTYGTHFATRWITVHDTATDGSTAFNANLAAKNAGGTPFKRPENGQFRPTSGFREFVFTETGDTSNTSGANGPSGNSFGGWGGLLRITQSDPSADTGTLRPFFLGDQAHTGLDNITYLTRNDVIAVEDAGDGLHGDRDALDSAYVFHYGPNNQSTTPLRFIAEGRDPSATLDAANGGFGPNRNEGDNEITGMHVSDGNPTISGLIGTLNPQFGVDPQWRMFWTQQHGDNPTWEVLVKGSGDEGDQGDQNSQS